MGAPPVKGVAAVKGAMNSGGSLMWPCHQGKLAQGPPEQIGKTAPPPRWSEGQQEEARHEVTLTLGKDVGGMSEGSFTLTVSF